MLSFLSAIDTITPTRNLNVLYIILDSIFILAFAGMLIWKKRYSTLIFALFGGVLYTIVDFGGFYLLSHSRTVSINGEVVGAGYTFLVLLWMSMSYGFTNFAFMWVLINRDELAKYWVFMIVMWWMICPSMSELGGDAIIETYRTTGKYHGWMAVVMATQWIALMVILMHREGKKAFVDILRLCLIGFFVQFGWEFALLINGIRPMNGASIQTLIVNSFLETNMCMPTTWLVYILWTWRFNEDMSRAPKTKFTDHVLAYGEKGGEGLFAGLKRLIKSAPAPVQPTAEADVTPQQSTENSGENI